MLLCMYSSDEQKDHKDGIDRSKVPHQEGNSEICPKLPWKAHTLMLGLGEEGAISSGYISILFSGEYV